MSTDIGVDNVADNSVTELTNNLDKKKKFSHLEFFKFGTSNSFSETNAGNAHLSLAIELKLFKKDF